MFHLPTADPLLGEQCLRHIIPVPIPSRPKSKLWFGTERACIFPSTRRLDVPRQIHAVLHLPSTTECVERMPWAPRGPSAHPSPELRARPGRKLTHLFLPGRRTIKSHWTHRYQCRRISVCIQDRWTTHQMTFCTVCHPLSTSYQNDPQNGIVQRP
jgi:hypothetical protein